MSIDMEADALNGLCAQSSGVIGSGRLGSLNKDGIQLNVAGSDFKARRHSVQEFLKDTGAIHADDAIVWTGHANIGDISGSLREDMLIGRGYMGVSSHYGGNPSIKI